MQKPAYIITTNIDKLLLFWSQVPNARNTIKGAMSQ